MKSNWTDGWYRITWEDDSTIIRRFKDGEWENVPRNPFYERAKKIEPVMVMTAAEYDAAILEAFDHGFAEGGINV